MAINHWPRAERPREKLLHRGAQALSDAELLAIFLRTGYRGTSAVDLARDILGRFGGLRQVLRASPEAFCGCKGLGPAAYSQLQAVQELSRRQLLEEIQRCESLCSAEQTRQFLVAQLRDQPRELFACLFLDNQHQLIRYEVLFYGTIDAAAVYPREVLRRCIELNAAAVIFAHNHPSGIAEPSQSDRHITDRLVAALGVADIRVLDHFVVGDARLVSFAERGWL